MNEKDVIKNAFAMPLTNPAFPKGPYRFFNREYFVITYRTDANRLRAAVPEPLQIDMNNPIQSSNMNLCGCPIQRDLVITLSQGR